MTTTTTTTALVGEPVAPIAAAVRDINAELAAKCADAVTFGILSADLSDAMDAAAQAGEASEAARGRIAKSIRDIMSAVADKKLTVEFVATAHYTRAEALLRDWHAENIDANEYARRRAFCIETPKNYLNRVCVAECGYSFSAENRLTPKKAADGERYVVQVEPKLAKTRATGAAAAAPTPAAAPAADPTPTPTNISGVTVPVDPKDVNAIWTLLIAASTPGDILFHAFKNVCGYEAKEAAALASAAMREGPAFKADAARAGKAGEGSAKRGKAGERGAGKGGKVDPAILADATS